MQLQERLKREGVKTHKERVEELNKYLSGLSEHHDMYVFDMSSPTTWYTKALALVVADKLAGRKSDPVEIPCLLFGWGMAVFVFWFYKMICPWELQHITTTTATLGSVLRTASPETSGRQQGGQADKSHVCARSSDLQGVDGWLHEYTTRLRSRMGK